MKKFTITIILFFIAQITAHAHYLWVDTAKDGKIGVEQNVKIHYGEYTYGAIEEVNKEAFTAVSKFTLWLIHPNGKKEKLNSLAKENHYLATFIPAENGVYTLALDNNNIDVIDYTAYDFGIFKTHYHSTANVQVGNTVNDITETNKEGLIIKELPSQNQEISLQVLYKGKPLAKNEVQVYVADQWSKELETDENGMVTFKMPWSTKYILETTTNEDVPGNYNGEKYEFVWHCATYCINN
ncbi:DUF4198 domain-containing protein [uncultured Maribacter sp.]|uniref:DUF4198 domain-containing protein n=1 Tax=uncultured Maribacter sp. TaxID=431308 RepID=UPI0026303C84|nr:DUF4198 domain-containing protein [uncultured Maribacter sp.]